jgi:hypothetical protein
MNFSFTLKGRDWIGLYLAVFVFYFIPAIAMQFFARHMQKDPSNVMNLVVLFSLFIIMMLSMLILATPILNKIINSIHLNDRPLNYSGKIVEFVFLNIGGLLLCIITVGIYFPWYVTKLMRYLVGKTSYNNSNFIFNGKGLHLLGLLAATLLLPMILYSMVIACIGRGLNGGIFFAIFSQIIVFLVMIPYIYWIYKWMMNITYKEYLIKWDTIAIQSMGKILLEMVLTIITLGIYYPVAFAKLYQYFIRRTVICRQDIKTLALNAQFNFVNAWKIVWSQLLLTIVTCGIYGAWAYCRIIDLFISNTSLVKYKEPGYQN